MSARGKPSQLVHLTKLQSSRRSEVDEDGIMLLDSSPLAFATVVIASILWRKHREKEVSKACSPEVRRFRSLMANVCLAHPFLRAEFFQRGNDSIQEEDCVANFTDLAIALASCCGKTVNSNSSKANDMAQEIGTSTRRIFVIVCDGLGNAILEQHLPESSFLHRHNQSDRLRAVFPSTTPAALTTLATAQYPGQHSVPGWDLREQQGCDFPGEPSAKSIMQLRILAPRIMNVRNNEPANYSSLDDVFLVPPWSRSLSRTQTTETLRRMLYINAYNGDEFPSWCQGKSDTFRASDFSSWQTGQTKETTAQTSSTMLDVATIGETAFSTLGDPEGSRAALQYFKDGIDRALCSIAGAEAICQPAFTYLHTAHPDKHMHALGTGHPEVSALVNGFNDEIEHMWNQLADRSKLLSSYGVQSKDDNTPKESASRIDAAIVVTADHGHVSVFPKDMLVLPDGIIECLKYANIGVHGKVRDR